MRFSPGSSQVSNAGWLRLSLAALATVALGVTAPSAHAQALYLVGAELYSATSTGADANSGYLYSTNTATTNVYALQLILNGATYDKGIALQLAPGANNFTIDVSPGGVVDPLTYAGLGLFFSTSPTSYNPSGSTAAPDLVFSSTVGAGTSGDLTPTAGTNVASYNFNGTSVANGATSLTEGGFVVSVSNLVTTHSATGSFTINDSATAPEPNAILLAVVGSPLLVGAVGLRRRRK